MQNQNDDKTLLPHHEQQSLCTTRLPYRQGRKLTAVKVYTISKESNHLLIFGVPSLNLRQETKALFSKFGKLLQFNVSKDHAAEAFTETFHAQYERIQSARHAKCMTDTKNFYGGSLHVCYAPELETIDETQQKLIQRQRDVVFRLKNLIKEDKPENKVEKTDVNELNNESKTNTIAKEPLIGPFKLNMGDLNTIKLGDKAKCVSKKHKLNNKSKFQPCFIDNDSKKRKIDNIRDSIITVAESKNIKDPKCNITDSSTGSNITSGNIAQCNATDSNIDIIDCTGVQEEIITNINEHLNYNKFGNEVIRKVTQKPVNKIQFHLNK